MRKVWAALAGAQIRTCGKEDHETVDDFVAQPSWLDMSFEEPWSELLNALLDRPSNSFMAALVINGESNVKNEWKRG